jgi:hypothetical protein
MPSGIAGCVLSTDTKVYAGQNARKITETLMEYSLFIMGWFGFLSFINCNYCITIFSR